MAITFPFNFRPSGQDFGNDATSYTVPADKYALVTVCVSVSACGKIDTSGAQTLSGNAVTTSNSQSFTAAYWLDSTDTISMAKVAPSATAASGSNFSIEDESEVSIDIGANTVAQIRAKATASGESASGSGTIASIEGTTDANFSVQEYDLV